MLPFIFNIEKPDNIYFDSLRLTKRSLIFEDIEFEKSERSESNVYVTLCHTIYKISL